MKKMGEAQNTLTNQSGKNEKILYSNNLNLKIAGARQERGGGKTTNVTIRATRRHIKVIREGRRVDGGDDSGPTVHALNSLKNVATR